MKNKVLNILLVVVFGIGIVGGGLLVIDEIESPNTCPKLFGIPACYIILVSFVVPFFTHIVKGKNLIYFIFTGFAFVIALVATAMQIMGSGECPKTNSGIPMCYYSLLLFTSLIVLKILIIKTRLKN